MRWIREILKASSSWIVIGPVTSSVAPSDLLLLLLLLLRLVV